VKEEWIDIVTEYNVAENRSFFSGLGMKAMVGPGAFSGLIDSLLLDFGW